MILDTSKLEKTIVEWNGKTFKKMKNLEILIIRNTHFSQGPKHLPNSLRVLEWWNYPSNSLPSDFYPKELAIFKLPESSLMSVGFIEKRKFWFMNLNVLKLDKSDIEYIPDVSGVPNLETLSFVDCGNLIKVHESIGFLDKLSQLGVSGCSKLRSFPALMLPCLVELDFMGCSSLEKFPKILADMEGLTCVDLCDTSIKELPYSFTNLSNLQSLKFGNLHGNYDVSSSISRRHELNVYGWGELEFPKHEDEDEWSSMELNGFFKCNVSFEFCNTLDEFFVMFHSLFFLVVTLHLFENDLTILPESMKELCSLRKLTLNGCKELREIRGLPPNIEEFSVANLMSLTILPESFKELRSLRKLLLDGCQELREIRGIPPTIEEFSAANCMSLTILPESFKKLCSLRKLTLDGCQEIIRKIIWIPPNIEEFSAANCMSLTILPESFKNLFSLRKLTLDGCRGIIEIRGIPPNIEEFSAANCIFLTILPESIKELCSLRKLTLDGCKELREIRGIPPNIETFSAAKCMSLTILPESFKELRSLRKLTLDGCHELREIRGIPPNIEEFSAANCMSLTILSESIKELCSLRKLTLDGCKELKEIRGFPPNIKVFSAVNCLSLTPSCRSMLLNEEYYSCNGYGYESFFFPGDSIPKRFEHSSRNSISFWFRNKPPSFSVCVVWKKYLNVTKDVFANVYINGNKVDPLFMFDYGSWWAPTDHIAIVNQGRMLCDHELEHKLLSENEWNHMVIVASRCKSIIKEFGFHVHKHASNMEDIRFTDPLFQEKEVNIGYFHIDTEQEKNLTTLASVETQQRKCLSLQLLRAINLLNDNVDRDLNSGSDNDSWKHDNELLSLRPCWEEPLDRGNLESDLMQLAYTIDTIKDQGCEEPSRKGKRSTLMLDLSEVDSDSESIMARLASDDTNSGGGCGEPSRKRKKSALMLDLNTEPISEVDLHSDSVMARMASDDTNSGGGKQPSTTYFST